MKVFIVIAFLILCASTFTSAEVLVRVDEQGKKVFYNPEPKKVVIKPLKVVYKSNKGIEYTPLIEKACSKYGVDPELVKAVIQTESAYNPKALSRAGAIGLMQLMPATASRFGVKQIYDPTENIDGGVKYLKFLLELFQNDLSLAVAAYNAGEGAVQRFKGIPRYTETQNYVRRVLSLYGKGDYRAGAIPLKVQTPTAIFKYVDDKGLTHFTTQRPKAGAVNEIKL